MLRIAIAGAAGRMGKTLIEAIWQQPQTMQLTAASVLPDDSLLGRDVGFATVGSEIGVIASSDLAAVNQEFDVLIDFTTPECSLSSLTLCEDFSKAMVLGTTGFDAEQLQRINAVSGIPLMFAPNMSVGVNLCFNLLQRAAQVLGETVDIEITEAHHRFKKDAPSGTALKMGELIAEKLDRKLDDVAIYGREGLMGEREASTIGFSTIRAGDIVGEHTVTFAGLGERLEISHKASSRMTFASGALRAAQWVVSQPPSVFSMMDMLGLPEI